MNAAAVDPALVRGMTQARLGRRDAVALFGLSAAALGLYGCGVKGQGRPVPSTLGPDAVARFWAGKTKHGHLDFANWPLYMNPKHPELAELTRQTGITVNYQEVIEEMGPWFAKVQPQLAAGQSIGYDLMIITNGIQFKQFVQSNFLAPLDHSQLPNFAANAAPAYRSVSYDRRNVYSVPWASGMTGIAYNPAKVTTPPTLLADLWNPAYKGKVGMFSNTSELGNFGMLVLGIDPATSTSDDWRQAADKLKEQKSAGIVRKYYEQDYIDALGSGEVWVTQAWSGDIFQKNLEGSDFRFVIPQEGGTIWTDNFTIPVTAANPVDALICINFFYGVDIAAQLTEFINYVTPVPAARRVIESHAAAASGKEKAALEQVAHSPLVFPTPALLNTLHYYRDFATTKEQQLYQSIFEPVVLG